LAMEHKPKMIIAGASAYARVVYRKRFRVIADQVGGYLMVDMSHYAGFDRGGHISQSGRYRRLRCKHNA